MNHRNLVAGVSLVALSALVACAVATPPPTSPAWGYRKKHEPPPPPTPHEICVAQCESTYAVCWRAEEARNQERWRACLAIPGGPARDSCIAEQRRLHFAEAQACLDQETQCINGCPK